MSEYKVKIDDFENIQDLKNHFFMEIDSKMVHILSKDECKDCYKQKVFGCFGGCLCYKKLLFNKKYHFIITDLITKCKCCGDFFLIYLIRYTLDAGAPALCVNIEYRTSDGDLSLRCVKACRLAREKEARHVLNSDTDDSRVRARHTEIRYKARASDHPLVCRLYVGVRSPYGTHSAREHVSERRLLARCLRGGG